MPITKGTVFDTNNAHLAREISLFWEGESLGVSSVSHTMIITAFSLLSLFYMHRSREIKQALERDGKTFTREVLPPEAH